MYKGPKETVLVDTTVGHGLLALCAARDQVKYFGYCLNATHLAAVHQRLLAVSVCEIIRGQANGFQYRRFLTRELSLGGNHGLPDSKLVSDPVQQPPPADGVAQPARADDDDADDAAEVGGAAKALGVGDISSSSSSEQE